MHLRDAFPTSVASHLPDSDGGPRQGSWHFHLAGDGWSSGSVSHGLCRSPALSCALLVELLAVLRLAEQPQKVSIRGDVIQLALAMDRGLDSYKLWMNLSSSLVSSTCSSLWEHACVTQDDSAQLH